MSELLKKMIRSQYNLEKHHDDIAGRNELVNVIAEAEHESSKKLESDKAV